MAKTLDLLITGGTGYIGAALIPRLLARGHRLRLLARAASVARVPAGATTILGDALDPETIAGALRANDALVHLVGTPHPNPSKAAEFQRVDLPSIRASVTAARRVGIAHLIYVSVAQPAPVMRAFVAARTGGGDYSRSGARGDHLKAVVCPGSRSSLGDGAHSALQIGRTVAAGPRERPPTRARNDHSNG